MVTWEATPNVTDQIPSQQPGFKARELFHLHNDFPLQLIIAEFVATNNQLMPEQT